MVAIRPIPRRLLPHFAVLQKNRRNQWGDAETIEESELRFVRIEPSSKMIKDKNNNEIQLAATLFFDCKNSGPKNILFEEGDTIVFNNQKHRIQLIEPLYDEKRLHHFEIGLVSQA